MQTMNPTTKVSDITKGVSDITNLLNHWLTEYPTSRVTFYRLNENALVCKVIHPTRSGGAHMVVQALGEDLSQCAQEVTSRIHRLMRGKP